MDPELASKTVMVEPVAVEKCRSFTVMELACKTPLKTDGGLTVKLLTAFMLILLPELILIVLARIETV